jgi:shikimate kinase
MSVVLIGYRGSGKTTVGKRLADQLWQPFVDTDTLVVRKAGRSIREIFDEQGEPGFRELESQAVREALLLREHVISLGGGALLREENRAALKASGHKVIHLKCDAEELHKRITADPDTAAARPDLTAAGGIDEVRELLAAREPTYRAAMTAELDVTRLSPQDAVVYIVRLL